MQTSSLYDISYSFFSTPHQNVDDDGDDDDGYGHLVLRAKCSLSLIYCYNKMQNVKIVNLNVYIMTQENRNEIVCEIFIFIPRFVAKPCE